MSESVSGLTNNVNEAIVKFGKPIVDRFERALADGIAAQFDYPSYHSMTSETRNGELVIQFREGELNLRELTGFILMQKRFD